MIENFYSLQPERILDAVEGALDLKKKANRATGRIQALNSVENRVYLIELEDGTSVVSKFYRPHRWTAEQIGEEHQFLKRLHDSEVPAVAPIPLTESSDSALISETIGESKENIYFAVFPQVKGRLLSEVSNEQIRIVGRFLARIHNVGEKFQFKDRLNLNVETYGRKNLEYLLNSDHIDENFKARYKQVVEQIFLKIDPLFKNVKTIPIHGDCHVGNLLWKDEQNPFFVDFDDCLTGPPVQDMWMILTGRDEATLKQRDELLGAYEQMREFDYDSLRLIEPLRALRMINYAAWIARRWKDPSFPKLFPLFGTQKYWGEEIEALHEILDLC